MRSSIGDGSNRDTARNKSTPGIWGGGRFNGAGNRFVFWLRVAADRRYRLNSPMAINGQYSTSVVAEPWTIRPDWAAGRITSSTKGRIGKLWIGAAIMLLVTGIFTVNVFRIFPAGEPGHYSLIFLVLPAFGLVPMGMAVQATRRWSRYGESIFEMTSIPGVVGGTLDGTIQLRSAIRPLKPVQLRLFCESITRGPKSTQVKVLWQAHTTVEIDNSSTIPISFPIPADCPAPVSKPGINWILEAKADPPGVKYVERFVVPVYEVGYASSPKAAYPVVHVRHETIEQPRDSSARTQPYGSNGKEFYFPAFRNAGLLPLFVIMSAAFMGFGVVFHRLQARGPGSPWGSAVIVYIFGLVGLFILFMGLKSMLTSQRVEVDQNSLAVITSVFGIKSRRRFAADEITGIKTTIGMRVGTNQDPYYDIVVTGADGAEMSRAGTSIKDGQDAERLAGEMRKALGLQS